MDAPVEEADDDRCRRLGLGMSRKAGRPEPDELDELRLLVADNGDRNVESSDCDCGEYSEFIDEVDEWDSVGVRGSLATITMG